MRNGAEIAEIITVGIKDGTRVGTMDARQVGDGDFADITDATIVSYGSGESLSMKGSDLLRSLFLFLIAGLCETR